MSGMFVKQNQQPDEITIGENTVFIRPRMDVGDKNRVMSIMQRFSGRASFDLGGYQMGLLIVNILDWKGKDFKGVKCNEENIRRLDPTNPLVDKLLEEISLRNEVRTIPAEPTEEEAAVAAAVKAEEGTSPNPQLTEAG